MSRPSICPYRVGGGHSMTSTNFTTDANTTITTNADDVQLVKSNKKKKNLFKNLFNFGSKKGRSKSMEPDTFHKKDEINSSANAMKMYSPDYNRKYQLEQERINMQYRKLLEEQKHQQQRQQPNPFYRNQLHPMHQSMPLSNSHRSKSAISPRNAAMPQLGTPQLYVSNTAHRDTVGVPQINKNDKINNYLRPLHRVHPELVYNDNNNQSMVEHHNQVCVVCVCVCSELD